MRLMERDVELDRMVTAFDRAGNGRGCVVLVSGDAGLGKTRLVTEFLNRVAGRARTFQGGCDDLLTPRTLGPFRDIVRFADDPLGAVEPDDRDGLLDALLDVLGETGRTPVLCIEDIHWADQATVDLVCMLARRMDRLPAVLVLTHRDPRTPNDPVLRVSTAVAPEAIVRVELSALSDAAVGILACEAGRAAGPVVRLVGGNPFFLGEILAAAPDSLPSSIVQAVNVRLATLPTPSRSAVELLSLIPTGTEHWLSAALLPDPTVLEPAESTGLLVHTPRSVQFRHELARRAIAADIPPTRTVVLHQRILGALVRTWADPSRLVHHAVGARDTGATARYARVAAEAAARAHSHREAAAFAELALDQDLGRTSAEAAALHRIATTAYYAMNDFGSASRHADQAVAMWSERTAPTELADALLLAARLSTLRGQPRDSMAAAMRAFQLVQPLGPSRTLALAMATIGSQFVLRDHVADGLDWCGRGLELAEQIGAEDVMCYALVYRGFARSQLGDDAGLVDQQHAVDLATRLGHGDYLTVASHNLAVTHLRACRTADALPLLELAARTADEYRLDTAHYRIDAQRAYCLLLQGLWPQAEQLLRALLAMPGDPGANAVNPLAFLGRLLARRGDPAAADLVDRAWQEATRCGEGQKMAAAGSARLEWLWLTGDLPAVVEFGAECLELAVRTHHHLLHAEVLRHLRRAGRPVVPFVGCPAPYAAGISGHCAEAAARWHRVGNPYEEALELSECVDRESLTRGLDMLDRLGADAAATTQRRRLRRRGVRGIPRGRLASTRSNTALLTRRQSEVLDLLLAGRTNAEIADQLVLSQRTVDNHVGAILRALGVSSRREVAAALERGGLGTR
jgi:DNA-binding CsgD family transcriptional regulator/tetratricopeptide (TPR) repeat protein